MSHQQIRNAYSSGSKFFHWTIAIIVISMLSVSFFLEDLPEQYIATAFMVHKSFGLTVLGLMLLRLLWIIHTGKPALPPNIPTWQRHLARLVQTSLYLFLFLMPLSGWMLTTAKNRIPVYFGMFSLPMPGVPVSESLGELMEQCHGVIAWILIGLIMLHVAGAFKHHVINKDDVLRSMLPGKRNKKSNT